MIDVNVTRIELTSNAGYLIKKMAVCDEQGEQVWKQTNRHINSTYYLTYDPFRRLIKFSANSQRLRYLARLNLCHDYLKFLLHPASFNQSYLSSSRALC